MSKRSRTKAIVKGKKILMEVNSLLLFQGKHDIINKSPKDDKMGA